MNGVSSNVNLSFYKNVCDLNRSSSRIWRDKVFLNSSINIILILLPVFFIQLLDFIYLLQNFIFQFAG